MKLSCMIESERIWRQLEQLLDMCDRAKEANKPRGRLLKDIKQLSHEWASALDREARAS